MKSYKHGLYIKNKDKMISKGKVWYENHKEKVSQERKREYASSPEIREKCKERARRRYREKPEQVRFEQRRKHLRVSYGLTVEKYNEMVASQQGRCAICSGLPTLHGRLYVDHDHDAGKVRELLCHSCNIALGMLKDRLDLCEKVIEYLLRHKNVAKYL
jgi:hypothetical protein